MVAEVAPLADKSHKTILSMGPPSTFHFYHDPFPSYSWFYTRYLHRSCDLSRQIMSQTGNNVISQNNSLFILLRHLPSIPICYDVIRVFSYVDDNGTSISVNKRRSRPGMWSPLDSSTPTLYRWFAEVSHRGLPLPLKILGIWLENWAFWSKNKVLRILSSKRRLVRRWLPKRHFLWPNRVAWSIVPHIDPVVCSV